MNQTREEIYLAKSLAFTGVDPVHFAPVVNRLASPKARMKEMKTASTLSLTFGALSFQSHYDGETPWLASENNRLSPTVSLRYDQNIGKRWFISSGPELRQYRFRTAFENVDTEARIFQPGTVDTIFRNLTTGEERIVTTDTVGGTRIRRFGNDNMVTELGLPILLGRRWSAGKHDFTLAAGPRLGFVLARAGRTVTAANTTTDLVNAPQFGQSFRWSARLEADYAFQLLPKLAILGRVGGEAALSDWSSAVELKQRPTAIRGQLGLRFSLK